MALHPRCAEQQIQHDAGRPVRCVGPLAQVDDGRRGRHCAREDQFAVVTVEGQHPAAFGRSVAQHLGVAGTRHAFGHRFDVRACGAQRQQGRS
jgi:hypothetical protein